MKYILIFLSLIIISCSPQKRLHRLLEKHPELLVSDTVYIKDTVITQKYKIDTIITYDDFFGSDTIYIQKDKLSIRIIHDTNFVKIKGECSSDTIYIDRKIPVNKMKEYVPTLIDKITEYFPILLVILICMTIVYFIARKR